MPDNRDEQKETPSTPEGGGPKSGGGRNTGPDANPRFSRSMLGWILILATAILLFVVFHAEKPPEGVSYSRFIADLGRGELSQITVKDEGTTYALIGTPNPSPPSGGPVLQGKVMARVPPTALDGNGWTSLQNTATQYQAELEYQPSSNYFLQVLVSLLPHTCFSSS